MCDDDTAMIRGVLTIFALVAVIALPWQLAAVLALLAGTLVPPVPLACGLLAEALYWAPNISAVPVFALSGAIATSGLYIVRGRIKASIIE